MFLESRVCLNTGTDLTECFWAVLIKLCDHSLPSFVTENCPRFIQSNKREATGTLIETALEICVRITNACDCLSEADSEQEGSDLHWSQGHLPYRGVFERLQQGPLF